MIGVFVTFIRVVFGTMIYMSVPFFPEVQIDINVNISIASIN